MCNKFGDYKKCLQNSKTILRSRQRFKSEMHNVFTREVNKIGLNSTPFFINNPFLTLVPKIV